MCGGEITFQMTFTGAGKLGLYKVANFVLCAINVSSMVQTSCFVRLMMTDYGIRSYVQSQGGLHHHPHHCCCSQPCYWSPWHPSHTVCCHMYPRRAELHLQYVAAHPKGVLHA